MSEDGHVLAYGCGAHGRGSGLAHIQAARLPRTCRTAGACCNGGAFCRRRMLRRPFAYARIVSRGDLSLYRGAASIIRKVGHRRIRRTATDYFRLCRSRKAVPKRLADESRQYLARKLRGGAPKSLPRAAYDGIPEGISRAAFVQSDESAVRMNGGGGRGTCGRRLRGTPRIRPRPRAGPRPCRGRTLAACSTCRPSPTGMGHATCCRSGSAAGPTYCARQGDTP